MTNLTLFHPGTFRRLFDGFPGDALFGTSFADGRDLDCGENSLFWSPRVDVRDTGAAVVIEADLPGVPREAIAIRFDSGTLTLEGRRGPTSKAPASANGNGNGNGNELAEPGEDAHPVVKNGAGQWTRRERALGRFRRTFRVPETVDASAIHAESRDGVLTITLPKLDQALPRKIEVEVR